MKYTITVALYHEIHNNCENYTMKYTITVKLYHEIHNNC